MSDEEKYTETRADYFAIDCDDPMFDMPEFVEDALIDWDERTNYGEVFHD